MRLTYDEVNGLVGVVAKTTTACDWPTDVPGRDDYS
jgi:hypothetical protein